jgi:hypothetical protein
MRCESHNWKKPTTQSQTSGHRTMCRSSS